MIGKMVTENLSKRTTWIALSGEKNVKVFVSYMTEHQTVTSAEQVLIIKWKDDLFVDSSQPFSPATPIITRNLMYKVDMMAGIEIMHGLSTLGFHSWLVWLQSLLSI